MAIKLPSDLIEDQTKLLVERWKQGLDGITLEDLYAGTYKGKKILPNVDERQEKLVEITINAGIETLLYDYLSRGHHTIAYKAPLSALVKKGAMQEITDFFSSGNPPGDVSGLMNSLSRKKLIKTANDLFTDPEKLKEEMEEFRTEVADFRAERDFFMYQMELWSDGLTRDPPVMNRRLPVEPRVKAFNSIAERLMGGLLHIHETGQKNIGRARNKMEDLGGDPLAVKDINRITVIAQQPQTVDYLSHALNRQMTSPDFRQATFNDEQWSISRTGCMDRKILVALSDHLFDPKRKSASPNHGTLAEIKIESTEMAKADELTHHSFAACRMMSARGRKFDPKATLEEYRAAHDAEKPKTQLAMIFSFVKQAETYYQRVAAQHGFSMDEFPHIVSIEELNNVRNLQHLFDGMTHFTQHLFLTKAVKHQNKDWTRLYAETAFDTIAEMEQTVSQARYEQRKINGEAGAGENIKAGENKIRQFIGVKDIYAMLQRAGVEDPPRIEDARRRIKEHVIEQNRLSISTRT